MLVIVKKPFLQFRDRNRLERQKSRRAAGKLGVDLSGELCRTLLVLSDAAADRAATVTTVDPHAPW